MSFLESIGNIFSEPLKVITRPVDKLLGTSITGQVDPVILPVIAGTGGFIVGGPPGAAIGAGLGRAAGGMSEDQDLSRILTNALYSTGLAYGEASGVKAGAKWLPTLTEAGATPTALEAATQTANPDLAAILADMGATTEANAAGITGAAPIAEAGVNSFNAEQLTGPEVGVNYLGIPPAAPAAASEYGPLTTEQLAGYGNEDLAMGAQGVTAGSGAAPYASSAVNPSLMSTVGGYLNSAGKWIGNNKMTTFMALNLLNSLNQANMIKSGNKAQQQSYEDYLKTINPSDVVKQQQYDILANQARTAGTLTQKKIDESLAARGVRGKGKAAVTGDVSEATRKAMNDAYNMVFSKFNVPNAPGPVNYNPSVTNLAAVNAAQLFAQELARSYAKT